MVAESFKVFLIFLRLGVTSFGGPVAHLGYFHNEFVVRRKWLDESAYADLVALCQFLPGPASSQVGMALGFSRAGYLGAFAAWLGFTLPSAVIMVAFALGVARFDVSRAGGWLHGLKIVAVAVVAQAVWSMGKKLCPDNPRKLLAFFSAVAVLFWPSVWTQVGVLALAAGVGVLCFQGGTTVLSAEPGASTEKRGGRKIHGVIFLATFLSLLVALPIAAKFSDSPALKLFDSFYRSGSLVFGGGHVVLPLLQAEVVRTGWVSKETFMAGYGAVQAVPGPLFSFSAYLGTVALPGTYYSGLLCLVGIFLPSFLLILGALPFWHGLRRQRPVQNGLSAINAAVVGVLLAAFYNPVITSAIFDLKDGFLAAIGFALLVVWQWPSWLVVLCISMAAAFF